MVFKRIILLALTACMILNLAACQQGRIGSRQARVAASLPTADLLREAETAFGQQHYPTSELYYARLAERPDLPEPERPMVLERLAVSAAEAGHYNSAYDALNRWTRVEPGAVDSPVYVEYGLRTFHHLGMSGGVAQLRDRLLHDSSLSWEARARGGVALAGMEFDAGEPARALETLDSFYAKAPDEKGRAAMERAFLRRLRDTPWDAELAGLVGPDNRDRFPYALIAFERARRQAEADGPWPAAWKTMRQVLTRADLAEKTYLADILMGLERDHGQPSLSVALAVPLTGRYQAVGRKIAGGAAAAQWKLAQSGVEVEVRVVNTDAAGWAHRVASLPPHFSLVGGPLRVSAFRELEAAGGLDSRAVFAFLPELAEGAEGSRAWRFFPSRRDEVRALAEMSVDRLGIRTLAVLAPDENYGSSMGALFRQEVTALGGSVVAAQTYPPGDHPQWGRRISSLLDVPADFDKEAPLPAPPFGAVFIPDGWAQAQLLIPNFFFYDASDVVFLGPDLWSRALDAKGVDEKYFDLAVCPGAWWSGAGGALELSRFLEAEGLGRADFWVALGYDYLRMAAAMGVLPAGWTPGEVNQRLDVADELLFSMAPLSWDHMGKASQRLYLFSPTEQGKTLAEPERIAEGVERAKRKRTRRMETWEETKKAERAAERAAKRRTQ